MPKKNKPDTNTPPESAEISHLQDQIKSLEESWKRALADYQNLLRRVENDKKEFVRLANVNLISRLLPSLDIMELSALHSSDIGVQMAAKQFHQALAEEGLQTIEPVPDSPFDHSLHECSETVALNEGKVENTISELVLKGYKIGDYVLRPAKVKVFKKLEDRNPEPMSKDQSLS
jgi:molecular chaperone GrpE